MKPFVHKKAAGGLTNKNREKIRSADRVNNQRLFVPRKLRGDKTTRLGERERGLVGLKGLKV
jgi:hypothetical protein